MPYFLIGSEANEFVNVNCSQEQYEAAQNDPDLLRQMFEEAYVEKENEEEEQLEESVCNSVSFEPLISPEEKGSNWSDSATKLLIALLKDFRPKLGQSMALITKKKMFQLIATELKKKGHFFEWTQVENKAKGLDRAFKNQALANKKTANSRIQCRFQNELQNLYEDRANVFFEILLGSSTSEEIITKRKTNESSSTLPSSEPLLSEQSSSCATSRADCSMPEKRSRPSTDTLKEANMLYKEKVLVAYKENKIFKRGRS